MYVQQVEQRPIAMSRQELVKPEVVGVKVENPQNLVLITGCVVLSLIMIFPVWDAIRLLEDGTYVYFLGRGLPISVIVSCCAVMVLFIAVVIIFFQFAREEVKTEQTVMMIATLIITILGLSLLLLSMPLAMQTKAASDEVFLNPKYGARTQNLYDYYVVLSNLRQTPECGNKTSIEECAGYEASQPYTGFLKFMELEYRCSGFGVGDLSQNGSAVEDSIDAFSTEGAAASGKASGNASDASDKASGNASDASSVETASSLASGGEASTDVSDKASGNASGASGAETAASEASSDVPDKASGNASDASGAETASSEASSGEVSSDASDKAAGNASAAADTKTASSEAASLLQAVSAQPAASMPGYIYRGIHLPGSNLVPQAGSLLQAVAAQPAASMPGEVTRPMWPAKAARKSRADASDAVSLLQLDLDIGSHSETADEGAVVAEGRRRRRRRRRKTAPEQGGSTAGVQQGTSPSRTFPPTLFTDANFQTTCDGMAARDLKFKGEDAARLLYLQGVVLLGVAVLISFVGLGGMCSTNTKRMSRQPMMSSQQQAPVLSPLYWEASSSGGQQQAAYLYDGEARM